MAGDLTRRVRALLRPPDPAPDAELLDRFLADRDESAFALIVRRHGPMVLAACRRVLRNDADADDAFQATFLVLARRAGAVRPRSMLANWLYGVAVRTAMEGRRAALVRRARERAAAGMRDPAAPDLPEPDLRGVLDRELAGLPDAYRAAVVLCDLEGLSRKDAADRLGWTEGTLSGRLARARGLLARRLARCGLGVPVAGLGLAAVVPPALAGSVARIGALAAAGGAAGFPAPVLALTEGVMKGMLLTKVKWATAALVVGCAVAVTAAAGWRADAVAQDQPGAKAPAAPKGKVARDADKARIAELERERDQLRKQVADLQARLAEVDAQRREELERARAAEDRARREAYGRSLDTARRSLDSAPGGPSPPNVRLDPEPRPGGAAPAPAKSEFKPGPRPEPKPDDGPPGVVSKVYPVGDLAADERQAEPLLRIVRAAVEPKSWNMVGGPGVVEYYPVGKALVVRNTPEAHRQLAELLAMLREAAGKKTP